MSELVRELSQQVFFRSRKYEDCVREVDQDLMTMNVGAGKFKYGIAGIRKGHNNT